jgi:amino acid transporter
VGETPTTGLQRHFGLVQATALNVTQIVGAGVFITIPLMLTHLPGPYAVLGWLFAGALMLVDSLIWSELGATMPGSGGSYLYLLECYGRNRWGRLMAFLFIWQFLISGPLEIGSGLIAIAQFCTPLSQSFEKFNAAHTWTWTLWESQKVSVAFGPSRMVGLLTGVLILVLLYRRVTVLGKVTVTFWLGVLAVIGWILVEGFWRFDPARAFDLSGTPAPQPLSFAAGLGATMRLAMYSYLGYYSICYIGDEVREPGRTIPRSILLSAALVLVMFVGLHLAMVGTVSWHDMPRTEEECNDYSLPAKFMEQIYGSADHWSVKLVTVLLIWACIGSAFAGLLGYSRIPYGAARYGHFFAALGRVHRVHAIPHVSLLLVGGLTLFWSLFSLGAVITALITTRIIEQFIGQLVGVVLLRRHQPERFRPYKMWLYPLPCGLALVGWLYMYVTAEPLYIGLGLGTLMAGVGVFLLWSWRTGGWPFVKTVNNTGQTPPSSR